MECKICRGDSENIFSRKILDKYNVNYYQCPYCQFIQTEEPYWLHEAYQQPISVEDTGILKRNFLCAKRTTLVLSAYFNSKGRFLDYGGGTGLFVRLMRDNGFDFYWNDLHAQNIFARGFEFDFSKEQYFDAATAFECFEHFVNPHTEITKLLSIAPSIIFSTEIFSGKAPHPDNWQYYYFSHGQHISLYSLKSLQILAETYKLHLLTNKKSFHVFTPNKHSSICYELLLKFSILGLPNIISLMKRKKADSIALKTNSTIGRKL